MDNVLLNDRVTKLMRECNLLNYVDNATPRFYFLADWVTEDHLYEYSKKLIELCAQIAEDTRFTKEGPTHEVAYQRFLAAENIRVTLGVKSQAPINAL